MKLSSSQIYQNGFQFTRIEQSIWDDIETTNQKWKSYKQLDALQDLCVPNLNDPWMNLNVYEVYCAESISQSSADLRQLILYNDYVLSTVEKHQVKGEIDHWQFEAISAKRNPPVIQNDPITPTSNVREQQSQSKTTGYIDSL